MMRRGLLVLLLVMVAMIAAPLQAAPNDPRYSEQWGMQKVGAETAWTRSKGAGVKIAIVDTGVDSLHEDLAGKVTNDGYDFIADDTDPRDENGHGTHVAGIAAATTFNGKGVAGVAPDASILPVRVLGGSGVNVREPDPDSIGEILASSAEGVRWAVDHGAKVINLSLGGVACSATGSQESCGPSDSLASAIEYAWSRGALCVIAAGNDDGLASGYTNEHAIVVVATTPTDTRPSFSNVAGDAIWAISAPGSSVLSTWYTYPIGDHKEYDFSSGTSMAAPHVSGAAALLFAKGLNAQQVVDRILGTAKDIGTAGKDRTFGYGRLDVALATDLAIQPPNVVTAGGGGSGAGGTGGRKVKPTTNPSSNTRPNPAVSESPGASPQPGPTLSSVAGSASGGGDDDGRPEGRIDPVAALAAAVIAAAGAGAFLWMKRREDLLEDRAG